LIWGLTLSESLWAAGTCLPFGAAYYCDIDHVNHPTLTACQIACGLPVTTSTLTLNTTGTGNGTVNGGGTYPGGTLVDAGSTFVGWSAGCSSGMPLTADTTCTATFDLVPTTTTTTTTSPTSPLPQDMSVFVQIDGTGSGSVTSPESGLSCQASDCQKDATGELVCATNCTTVVNTGSNLTLIPTADSNSIFSSWGGNANCVDGQLTTITESTLCVAYFRRLYQLTIEIQGPGNVTGNRPGYNSKKPINCGLGQTQCNNSYESGTQESLQAQPLANAQFQGWGGDCSGLQNPLVLNLSKDITCQAIFIDPAAVKLDQIITSNSRSI
jgi:Divergent InlB B-repeat domain